MLTYSEEQIVQKYKKGVYFYCLPLGPPEWTPYLFKSLSIAEGLKELGVPFYSNINYWKLHPDKEEYLFNHNPDYRICDSAVGVVEFQYSDFGGQLPEEIFTPERSYQLAYIDNADGIFTDSIKPLTSRFDIIFKGQKNFRFLYHRNMVPDAFGLTQRIIDYTAHDLNFESRERSVLVNFRVKHTLRDLFKDKFLPEIQSVMKTDQSLNNMAISPESSYDHLMWHQTGRRHHPGYYEKLKNSMSCAAIGGNLMQTHPFDYFSTSYYSKFLRKFFYYSGIGGNKRIIQFDSWRFWESLAAGCVTFHADLEKYGAELPEMPQNFKHYIGVDLDNMKATAERIMDQPGILKQIASEGKIWALEHYAPKATALRFLREMAKMA